MIIWDSQNYLYVKRPEVLSKSRIQTNKIVGYKIPVVINNGLQSRPN